jgi:hypothetical protein
MSATGKKIRGCSADGEEDQSLVMLKFVEDFQKIQRPEVKDLSALLITFIKFYVENKRLLKLEEEIDELSADIHNYRLEVNNNKMKLDAIDKKISSEVEILNNMIKNFKDELESSNLKSKETMSSVNILLQEKIDNDIIIRGFPEKPDVDAVCDNFMKFFNVDKSEILTHYYFAYTSRFTGKTSHNIIISFREKQTKLNILARKKQTGPLLLSRLLGDQPSTSNIITVTYSNRLSKFNLNAIYHLNKAKSSGRIFSVRFHNSCFTVKDNETSEWFRISNIEELQKYKSVTPV